VDSLLAEESDAKRLTETVRVSGEKEGITVSVAFCFSQRFGDNVVSFCNNINTMEGGTHVSGFKSGFAKVINQYARELGNLKDKDAGFTGNDTRNGMIAVISVSHPAPRFEGQTKTKLDNTDVQNVMVSVLNTQLQHYFDRNLETLKAVIARAEMAAKVRKEEEKIRTNLADKKFAFEGNGKLARQESNDPAQCEIFIVEGKSAGGTAKTGRDRRFQAILPIRGKILNVEKQSVDRVLANEEIKAIVNALGCGFSQGYGNDFNLENLKYSKIIIAADADVDGGHISTLLLTLFYRFMPELIYAGKLFRAMPPLYRVKPKKGKAEYIYDDKALAEYRAAHGNSFDVQRYKGLGEMDADQLWETTMNPKTRKLKQIAMEDVLDANRLTAVLMGEEVAPRRDYIVTNADKANLDV
jgi:DNA gyrase subunit B